jgi:A/G-specific adenine glycosylase
VKPVINVKGSAVSQGGASEEFADASFSADVIGWQKQYGRHVLPWQNTRDGYRVWLSEIMLQQTQVAAVIPYYQRFLTHFPDLASLAAAPVEAVMAQWSGLGYYSRARNLHKCAQRVVAEHGGVFPADPVLLADLPGIGRSTAAAVAAFSYGVRAAILDGNVKRVFARVFGIDAYPGEKAVEDTLWRRAEALMPQRDVESNIESGIESYTQGLMDLGATLCTRSKPLCASCPLQQRCVAYASGRVEQLPVRKPKKTVPEKHTTMLLVTGNDQLTGCNQVLLEQRPELGIWGGLLSLPELDGQQAGASATEGIRLDVERLERMVSVFGVPASCEQLATFSHSFTHFKLHITPYHIKLARRRDLAGQMRHVWLDSSASALASAPLPAPVKKLLLAVFREGDLLSV